MIQMMWMMRISLCNHRRRKAKRDNTCQVVYWSLHFTDYNRYQHHHSQEAGCGEVEDEYLGVSIGDGGADDDDHEYDEDEGQCWYLGVTTGDGARQKEMRLQMMMIVSMMRMRINVGILV